MNRTPTRQTTKESGAIFLSEPKFVMRSHVCEKCGKVYHCVPCSKILQHRNHWYDYALYSKAHAPNGVGCGSLEEWHCDECRKEES